MGHININGFFGGEISRRIRVECSNPNEWTIASRGLSFCFLGIHFSQDSCYIIVRCPGYQLSMSCGASLPLGVRLCFSLLNVNVPEIINLFKMTSLRDIQPLTSSNNIPTLRSPPSLERSSSYENPADNSPSEVSNQREPEYQVKATLTGFLNDTRVKSSTNGSRRVQNALMETEQELRQQRRQSTHSRRGSKDDSGQGNSFVSGDKYQNPVKS